MLDARRGIVLCSRKQTEDDAMDTRSTGVVQRIIHMADFDIEKAPGRHE